MRQLATALTAIILTSFTLSARESSVENVLSDSIDNRQEILEQLENLPNIEVGNDDALQNAEHDRPALQ